MVTCLLGFVSKKKANKSVNLYNSDMYDYYILSLSQITRMLLCYKNKTSIYKYEA